MKDLGNEAGHKKDCYIAGVFPVTVRPFIG